MCLPLVPCCHSSRNDADFLLTVIAAIRMSDHDDYVFANLPERPPLFLTIGLPVGDQEHERVAKHSGCVFKADTVLFEVIATHAI